MIQEGAPSTRIFRYQVSWNEAGESSVIERSVIMKTKTTIVVGVIIVLSFFTGCASTGKAHKTAKTQQLDQGSYIQSMDKFADELIY